MEVPVSPSQELDAFESLAKCLAVALTLKVDRDFSLMTYSDAPSIEGSHATIQGIQAIKKYCRHG